ncbi:MAG: erythromycin esterase family protein [Candidatus Competibacteraceae bacterium]|nr:MAG: erythromycin esterase family protein [Candidatus Competibacteraceae bacterium]
MTIPRHPFILLALLVGLGGIGFPGSHAGELPQALRALAQPLRQADDLTPLLDAVGDARWVLLGEASHGTREFYTWRDALSRRLIEEQGFSFIAVEGDWSALIPLDRYVRHHPDAPASAREALLQIQRWPLWMWANTEMAALGEWLREFNRARAPDERVGIHGIDVYGLWDSLDAVLAFYQTQLPEPAAAEVRQLYQPLQAFQGDNIAYARHVHGTGRSARAEVARVAEKLTARYQAADPEQRRVLFEPYQHAKVVEYGERHLRGMAQAGPASWNARAQHFKRTVARLLEHYGPDNRGIVWAHNTHIGDARATDMARTGQVNIGQLARERHGADTVFAVGFGTATGTVLAARRWEGRREIMATPEPRPDSLEAALLAAGDGDRFLILDRESPAVELLREPIPHRAIGVIFIPERERLSNYVPTRLTERYDAFVFLPRTRALDPLHEE